MAGKVLAAARPLSVTVVCDDAEVAAWARASGAGVVLCPGRGLNAAVADGVAHLADHGFDVVVVAHADLPLATGLAHLAEPGVVTLVPDRHDDGTNVLVVPSRAGFRFAYGPGSFRRHVMEAERLALPHRVVRDRRLGWDVDIPDDLTLPSDLHPTA
jgi:2-phospho-L-lactate guanylyltransferase